MQKQYSVAQYVDDLRTKYLIRLVHLLNAWQAKTAGLKKGSITPMKKRDLAHFSCTKKKITALPCLQLHGFLEWELDHTTMVLGQSLLGWKVLSEISVTSD
jgi:hypothetical protein